MPQWLGADLVIPDNDAPNREYFEQQAAGALRLPRCTTCKLFCYPVRTMCPDCHSNAFQYEALSGKGRVYSYFILSEPISAAFQPYPNAVVALIELDEQRGVGGGGDRSVQPDEARALRMVGNIVRADGSFEDPAQVAINKRVRVHIVDLGDGMGLPQWELSGEPSEGPEWQVP